MRILYLSFAAEVLAQRELVPNVALDLTAEVAREASML